MTWEEYQNSHDLSQYNDLQLSQLKRAVAANLTSEQMAVLENPKLRFQEMSLTIMNFEEELKQAKWEEFKKAHNISEYNMTQQEYLKRALEGNLTPEQMSLMMHPEYSDELMRQVYMAIRDDYTPEEIAIFTDPAYDGNQRTWVISAIDSLRAGKIDAEQLDVIRNPELKADQIKALLRGAEYEIPAEQLATVADPKVDAMSMTMILATLYNEEITEEQMKFTAQFAADPKVDSFQVKQVLQGFENGLDIRAVSTFANPDLDHKAMKQMREDIENGVITFEEVEAAQKADAEPESSDLADTDDSTEGYDPGDDE